MKDYIILPDGQRVEIPDAVKELYGMNSPSSAKKGPAAKGPATRSSTTRSPAASTNPSTATKTTSDNEPLIVVLGELLFMVAFVAGCLLLGSVIVRATMDLSAIGLINSNHGMTLEEFCENTRYEPYEYWGVFDETGKKLGECTSHNVGCVEVPTELFEYGSRRGATTSVHCHPGYNCPFSVPDLLNFVAVCLPLGMTEICVVSEDYLYQLEKPAEVKIDYIDFRTYLGLYVRYRLEDPTYFEYVELEDGTTGYISTDALIAAIADEFGLVFTKTPLD